jgi:hypothetical protein
VEEIRDAWKNGSEVGQFPVHVLGGGTVDEVNRLTVAVAAEEWDAQARGPIDG